MSHDHQSPNVNYMHIGLVAPFLGYAGYQMKQAADGKLTDLAPLRNMGMILIIVAVMIILFHSYLISEKMKSSDEKHNGHSATTVPNSKKTNSL